MEGVRLARADERSAWRGSDSRCAGAERDHDADLDVLARRIRDRPQSPGLVTRDHLHIKRSRRVHDGPVAGVARCGGSCRSTRHIAHGRVRRWRARRRRAIDVRRQTRTPADGESEEHGQRSGEISDEGTNSQVDLAGWGGAPGAAGFPAAPGHSVVSCQWMPLFQKSSVLARLSMVVRLREVRASATSPASASGLSPPG